MELPQPDIDRFIDLWRTEFGETLPAEEARHHASQLLALYELLATPPKEPLCGPSSNQSPTCP